MGRKNIFILQRHIEGVSAFMFQKTGKNNLFFFSQLVSHVHFNFRLGGYRPFTEEQMINLDIQLYSSMKHKDILSARGV